MEVSSMSVAVVPMRVAELTRQCTGKEEKRAEDETLRSTKTGGAEGAQQGLGRNLGVVREGKTRGNEGRMGVASNLSMQPAFL